MTLFYQISVHKQGSEKNRCGFCKKKKLFFGILEKSVRKIREPKDQESVALSKHDILSPFLKSGVAETILKRGFMQTYSALSLNPMMEESTRKDLDDICVNYLSQKKPISYPDGWNDHGLGV